MMRWIVISLESGPFQGRSARLLTRICKLQGTRANNPQSAGISQEAHFSLLDPGQISNEQYKDSLKKL
jgi:hypothetical protein